MMLRNTACVEVEWPASRRRMLATTRRLGSAQRAAAVLWAVAEGAYLLSGEPDAYGNPGFAIEV
ncbi:MAG TPA: hypothetical protein VES42_08005 [Pilimelia sp.]|nr:hypothetical protein [Pilimelia sp.]